MKHRKIDFVTIDNQQLYTEIYPLYENRPFLVFLHDSLGSVELWRDFPRRLAEATQCNLMIYDRWGYGKSQALPSHKRSKHYLEIEADTLNQLLSALKIDDAILFGHSDGGSIALISAAKFPQRIKAIICEAAHIFVEDITLSGIRNAISAYENTNLPQRLEKYHADKVDKLFKAWTHTWTREDYRDWNIEHFLPQINCPLLFIQGELDEYGTLDQVEKTISQVRGFSEKYIVPQTGHSPHKEVPEVILAASKIFMNKFL
ncbi:alpha/beta fold hydrolase [Elizabethkingia argentiflava]|uniref:Alpha/beta fold hydrolase n=1 Tax=Elizabethkingia argenteiflava TaxID=2681556 RepID=A0A845Q094_9FLAO|nr:alpha/beta hydrolase [Elizabethkingia argenteiflava]NAW52107.1 alpha/beta fold hydrolase [Elizabethkingia argenteiflava]